METWCDWIDAILLDMRALAEQLKTTLQVDLPARRGIADDLRASTLPSAAFEMLPGLRSRATLATTIARNLDQVQSGGEVALTELEALMKTVEGLRGCCPS